MSVGTFRLKVPCDHWEEETSHGVCASTACLRVWCARKQVAGMEGFVLTCSGTVINARQGQRGATEEDKRLDVFV